MSKIFFYVLAPALLSAVTVFLWAFAPAAIQVVVLVYAWTTYFIVLGWRLLVDRSLSSDNRMPLAKRGDKIPKPLRELALLEYEYIRETMAQAMNDRHTMVNYFLLATGVVLAAISAIYSAEGMSYSPYKNQMTIAVCLIFNMVSWIYLMMVVRLRQAWCESAAAMSRIKQFVLIHHRLSEQDAASPFRWTSLNIPPAAKKGTLYHFAVILISIVSSSGLALASLLLLEAEQLPFLYGIPAGWFLYNFFLQNSAYTVFLKEINSRPSEGIRLNHSIVVLLQDAATKEFLFTEQLRRPVYSEQAANGGMVEALAEAVGEGEEPVQAVRRAVARTTGHEVIAVEALTEFYVPLVGSLERTFVFAGQLGRPISEDGKIGEKKQKGVVRMPAAQAYQKLEEGFFKDARTIIALESIRSRVAMEV